MDVALIVVIVLVVLALAVGAGMLDRPRRARRRTVVVDRPVERVVERRTVE